MVTEEMVIVVVVVVVVAVVVPAGAIGSACSADAPDHTATSGVALLGS